MRIRSEESALELIPETAFEREALARAAAFKFIELDITTNSAADSSAWPSLGPNGTLRLLIKPLMVEDLFPSGIPREDAKT